MSLSLVDKLFPAISVSLYVDMVGRTDADVKLILTAPLATPLEVVLCAERT